VSGDRQTGTVGLELPDPLIVAVQDDEGRPAAGVPVSFSVESGEGSLRADTVSTDRGGLASNVWTLGTQPGDGGVSVRYDGTHEVVFSATAVAGPTSDLWLACLPFTPDREETCGYHRQVGVPFFPFSHVSTFDRYGNPTDPALDVIIVPGPGLGVTGDTVHAAYPIDSRVSFTFTSQPQDPSDSLLYRMRIAFLEDLLDSQWQVISRCLNFNYNPSNLDSIRTEMVTDSVRYLEDSERAVWAPMTWYGTAVVDSFPRSAAPVRGSQPQVLELYQAADWFWTMVPGHWGSFRTYLRPDGTGSSFVGTLGYCSVAAGWYYTYDEATLTRLR
jgi:hypothetical protein